MPIQQNCILLFQTQTHNKNKKPHHITILISTTSIWVHIDLVPQIN